MERFIPRIPAALVVAGLAIVIVSVFNLAEDGVAIIGEIPAGLPSLAWPDITFTQWVSLIPGAIAIVVVGFAESVAAARTYARKYGYKVDANQELIALGAANAASGLVGSFVVDGSLSKSAAADQAGQKTQLASIGLTAAVFITILFLTGLFENLPEATLGAIVIHAVWHLIDFSKVSRYWKIRGDDFWAGLAALLGVLAFDILAGLLIAVGVSFLLILARASRPRWAILGRTKDAGSDDIAYQSLEAHPEGEDGSRACSSSVSMPTSSLPTPTSSPTTFARPSPPPTPSRRWCCSTPSPSATSTRPPWACCGTSSRSCASEASRSGRRASRRGSRSPGSTGRAGQCADLPSVTAAVAAFERDGPRGLTRPRGRHRGRPCRVPRPRRDRRG